MNKVEVVRGDSRRQIPRTQLARYRRFGWQLAAEVRDVEVTVEPAVEAEEADTEPTVGGWSAGFPSWPTEATSPVPAEEDS